MHVVIVAPIIKIWMNMPKIELSVQNWLVPVLGLTEALPAVAELRPVAVVGVAITGPCMASPPLLSCLQLAGLFFAICVPQDFSILFVPGKELGVTITEPWSYMAFPFPPSWQAFFCWVSPVSSQDFPVKNLVVPS